jgi:hypothetical protein
LLARLQTTCIDIPYEIRTERLDQVIDLREPRTQAWLYERLSGGIPGVAFEYPGGLSSRLVWADELKKSDCDHDFWLHGAKAIITYGPYEGWDRRYYGGPENFMGLLPYLIFPVRGGSPITDLIGRWLRNIGAKALVYPSVRNDVECVIENGLLKRATGWNLVDYRGAPAPRSEPCLIIWPDSWRFAGDLLLHDRGANSEVPKFGRPDIRAEATRGNSAGTWSIVNQAKPTRDWFIEQQRLTAIGEQTHRALGASLNEAKDDRPGAKHMAQPNAAPEATEDENARDLFSRFVSVVQDVQMAQSPRQHFDGLLAMREFLLEHPGALAAFRSARASVGDVVIVQLWRAMFELGSTCLFGPQGDRANNVEEAIKWLNAAAALPIRLISPADWARTQGELATAYKNRVGVDLARNRDDAMSCYDRALEVFTPQSHRREWLLTIKQRAITRLEMPASDRGLNIERAIAELEFVVQHVDRTEDFVLWAGTKSALGAAYTTRTLGYFVDNAERSRAALEDVVAEAGDVETILQQGADAQRLQIAAAAALHLSRAYQIRRRGDPDANRERAVALLKSARLYFAATNRDDAVREIDDRLAAMF